jgi:hypothetical protein
VRAILVSALCSCVADPNKRKARRFLLGLSCDELAYIAEFLGCCILESHQRSRCTRWQLAEDIAQFERCRSHINSWRQYRSRPDVSLRDDEHKAILLLEYLCRCDLNHLSLPLHQA